ncbi:endonuclease/exonuclease/phosphatase family protein [Thalassotalea euphylliae]|uniref:Endonuclease/exonuclease/phosphatase family protein n=1 Tax=Thalassotalea euphylliae TaxID=1655234 RepID=A0A3E0TQQ3_9GAMM|nr:endonuclease/exonuclease/phosphatase family protein [Thalassotalea euphylliae]REL26844.1 endonuclease/exonuclease/phosphatase family protein [Thalassotalea euphylliae]
MKKLLAGSGLLLSTITTAMAADTIKIATFNVSMEALNYLPKGERGQVVPSGNELTTALNSQHQQIKNIAEIIQRVNPDILLLNEFDRTDNNAIALQKFLTSYLAKSQQGQTPVNYPYFYQGPVNTGVKAAIDINGDGQITSPQDTYGFGYFPGHFGMALLSKFPIDHTNIRTFQKFKWQDMPNALKPMQSNSEQGYYSDATWQELRLSSKSHWDIPVIVDNKTVHVLASHPTPPVFDGPEDRNGKRNHDEIRFWQDYISGDAGSYIYDDNGQKGAMKNKAPFVIMGDLNASTTDGDANKDGIGNLIEHPAVNDPMPMSDGGKASKPDNQNARYHTAHWGMRADYVLPSTFGWTLTDSGVFWPTQNSPLYRLIDSRAASSDHRLVWVELSLK